MKMNMIGFGVILVGVSQKFPQVGLS